MKAFMIERYGDKFGGHIAQAPDPQVGANDVLVKIHTPGVSLLDGKLCDGASPAILPYRLPLILGNELVGVVVRVGSAVTRFAMGDEVHVRPDKDRIGTFELVAVDQDKELGGDNLKESLRVLKPGGTAISVAGPPDPAFARELGADWILRPAMSALSFTSRRRAERRARRYEFLLTKAGGEQLRKIPQRIGAGTLRPIVDRVLAFARTKDAMEYVDKGRAKAGRVVVTMT